MTKKDQHSDLLGKVATVAGAAVAGVAVGAAAVVMADPKKRKVVMDKLSDMKEMVEDSAADAVKQGQKAFNQVSKAAGNFKDQMTEEIESAKSNLSEKLADKDK